MSREAETKKSHWKETLPSGEKVFCFKVRSHGKTVIYRYTLSNLVAIFDYSIYTNHLQPIPREA